MATTSRGYELVEGDDRNFPPDDINALARSVSDDVDAVVRTLSQADARLGSEVDAARTLNPRGSSASQDTVVTRASSPVPGTDIVVPAGIGIIVFIGADISCTVWNGACTLLLNIQETRLSDSATRAVGADVPWKAGLAGVRAPVTAFRFIGPESYGRRLRLHSRKDTTNADYLVQDATNFSGLLYRTGSVG